MRLDRGYLSPDFITDSEKMKCDPQTRWCSSTEEDHHSRRAGPGPRAIVKSGQSLLVVADDVDGEALATLVVNRVRGALRCAAVKAPGFGDRRRAMLEDIATLTGGQVLAEELGVKLETVNVSMLGESSARWIDDTTLVGGAGDKSAIQARLERLRREIKRTTSDYDKEKLQERLGKLCRRIR